LRAYTADEPGERMQFFFEPDDFALLGWLRGKMGCEDRADVVREALANAVTLAERGDKMAGNCRLDELADGCRIPPGRRKGEPLSRWSQWIFKSDRGRIRRLGRLYRFDTRGEAVRFALRAEARRRGFFDGRRLRRDKRP
jgi:hypothetical protein